MSDGSQELLRGTVDVLIMRTLAWEAAHGYGIAQWIRERTSGTLALQDAALYQALRRLEQRGWVSAEWGIVGEQSARTLLPFDGGGRRQLKREMSAWRRYADAVQSVLEPFPGEV